MALQDDVNDQVGAIHAGLDEAAGAAAALPGQIAAVDDTQETDRSAIVAAFMACAAAIDAIDGGDGSGVAAAAAAILPGSVSFVSTKTAMTGAAAAIAPHSGASNAMAGLLMDQSNYDGQRQ
jgi:hypothetical protein